MRALKTLLGLALAAFPVIAATTCENLASLTFPDATITSAQNVAAGAFTLPANPNGRGGGRGPGTNPYKDLPAFCRVTATLKPSSDSDIKIEVWLPAADWNQKYQAVGNGGWAGVISYSALADALRDGYATSSTDTGHVGGSGSFALGHPEKLIDFGWRSEHEMTLKSKAIIEAFYGDGARLSYWNGCSTGGRQGLKEAQRFPADYDGIIAGAPANRTALALWIAFAATERSGQLHSARQVSADPPGRARGMRRARRRERRPHRRSDASASSIPKTIECKGADGPDCLTAPQVEAVRKIYTDRHQSAHRAEAVSGIGAGFRAGMGHTRRARNPRPSFSITTSTSSSRIPNWDWQTFDFDKDIVRSEEPENVVMNATDPNLKPFFAHKGKLLMYHGWADPNISPLSTIQYYKSVRRHAWAAKRKPRIPFACSSSPAWATAAAAKARTRWTSQARSTSGSRRAPRRTRSSRRIPRAGKVDRTRPLCPYPQVAKYKGSGSIDEAANFSCIAP